MKLYGKIYYYYLRTKIKTIIILLVLKKEREALQESNYITMFFTKIDIMK